jgi:MFS family permease
LFIGRWTDKSDRQSLFVFGTISYIFSWLVKVLARSPMGVLIVDAYSRISKNALSVPFMSCVYGSAHNGSVMSTVVFFEMSLVVGKLLAIILCLILLQFFAPGWNAIFILGALFTGLYLLFKTK